MAEHKQTIIPSNLGSFYTWSCSCGATPATPNGPAYVPSRLDAEKGWATHVEEAGDSGSR